MQIAVACLLGIFSVITIYILHGHLYINLLMVFLILSVLCCLILALPSHRFINDRTHILGGRFTRFINAWNMVIKNRAFVTKLIFLVLSGYIIVALRLKYAFHVTYGDVGFISCLIFSIFTVLANLLAITPSALGIREFLIGASYKLMDGSPVEAVVATTLDRVAAVASVFILSAVFLAFFFSEQFN